VFLVGYLVAEDVQDDAAFGRNTVVTAQAISIDQGGDIPGITGAI